MDIIQTREGSKLIITIDGTITVLTAPELEAVLGENLRDVDELVFDLSKLQYTSSAGLRALLGAQQTMDDKDGKMIVRGVNELVMGVFMDTGFDKILDIRD